jgi:hypothetical protein
MTEYRHDLPDMDEGDPEMEAWMESLPPVDIDKLARDLKQADRERRRQAGEPVYVVTTVTYDLDNARVADLELLDQPPRWKALMGQSCRVGTINGGDSAAYLREEDGWGEGPAAYDPDNPDEP